MMVEEARAWDCDPANCYNCAECPHGISSFDWQGVYPCGRWHCLVALNAEGMSDLMCGNPLHTYNDVISRQAVMALDMFAKIFCRDYAVQDDLAFRCNQCEFQMPNGECLVKVMASKICPNYKNFGSMGDL